MFSDVFNYINSLFTKMIINYNLKQKYMHCKNILYICI